MILGLTGSIAMGKSTTAKMFENLGYPVFDADKEVHKLYGKNGQAVRDIENCFPDVIKNGAVDRAALAAKITDDPMVLSQIEKIVHPKIGLLEKQFVENQKQAGAKIIILDIPLLFEADRMNDVDFIVVVSTNKEQQRQRALQRPGMTPEKLDLILARQLSDEEKRARADFVIDTGTSLDDTFRQIKKLIENLVSADNGQGV